MIETTCSPNTLQMRKAASPLLVPRKFNAVSMSVIRKKKITGWDLILTSKSSRGIIIGHATYTFQKETSLVIGTLGRRDAVRLARGDCWPWHSAPKNASRWFHK